MKQDAVDFLIIGAGASGAVLTWSLSQYNFNVLCLEQGNWMRFDEYPSTKPDWERYRFSKFSADPNIRKRPEDYPINSKDSPITPLNFNAVGGSTIKYMARFPRFHPSDFRVKTLDGVADDWPVDYATLEPYYHLTESITGVSGLAGNPAYPLGPEDKLPPVPLDKIRGFNP